MACYTDHMIVTVWWLSFPRRHLSGIRVQFKIWPFEAGVGIFQYESNTVRILPDYPRYPKHSELFPVLS